MRIGFDDFHLAPRYLFGVSRSAIWLSPFVEDDIIQGAVVRLDPASLGSKTGRFIGRIFSVPSEAILIRCSAILEYFPTISAPAPRLLCRRAAIIVVPTPRNGSITQSPSFVRERTSRSMSSTGN